MDILPFPFKTIPSCTPVESLNIAFDNWYLANYKQEQKGQLQQQQSTEVQKWQRIIEEQQKVLHVLEIEQKENQRRGELLYEHYQEVAEVLTFVKQQKDKEKLEKGFLVH